MALSITAYSSALCFAGGRSVSADFSIGMALHSEGSYDDVFARLTDGLSWTPNAHTMHDGRNRPTTRKYPSNHAIN